MAADPLFGWDLTFRTVERDVTRKADVFIAFAHWNLVKRGFRCIGVGDEQTLTGDEEKSELLPVGWNGKENYTIRYVLDSKLYILHGLSTDGSLIINLMRSEDLSVSNLAVKVDDTIMELSGSISKMIPDHKELMYKIKRDLLDPITERPTTTTETQTMRISNECCSQNRWQSDQRNFPRPASPNRPDLRILPDANPLNVGRADLDPFAVGGGGMIFNPFAPRRDVENPGLGIPGGLPRGAVPPGARFDPFGPVAPLRPGSGSRRPPPDADHLPPPGGFNDNMFM